MSNRASLKNVFMYCTIVVKKTDLWGGAYDGKTCYGSPDWDSLSTDVCLLYLSIQSTTQYFLLEGNSSSNKRA